MIDTATARRASGDWAGACAAARVDVDLDLRRISRAHGREIAAQVRRDLRHFAPDLLRWHLPRVGPDGLLRPGVTMTLARYEVGGEGRRLHLVVRTPPAWADAGQRISLTVWDGSGSAYEGPWHPHPRPSARFRLDLHRHLWDARRAGELGERAGGRGDSEVLWEGGELEPRWAVDRWIPEAHHVLGRDGRIGVHVGAGRRLVLDTRTRRIGEGGHELPPLPDAATWVPPDLRLLRAGLIDAERLHPLVAAALTDGPVRGMSSARRAGQPHLVDCRGTPHRIGFVDGRLSALDHAADELRREELLVALGGPPLPCLQAIDAVHRRPDALPAVRERLAHGDVRGAFDVLEGLLGPEALLRDGPLRDALENAWLRRIDHGRYRAGLANPGPPGTPVLRTRRALHLVSRRALVP
ncbi:hypothetical protein [Streptomyces indicus]|nr:hypothetical protein [Streptomyces indicus]